MPISYRLCVKKGHGTIPDSEKHWQRDTKIDKMLAIDRGNVVQFDKNPINGEKREIFSVYLKIPAAIPVFLLAKT